MVNYDFRPAKKKSMGDKSTVLIVDDEIVSRYTVEALLSSEGYNLIFAENGTEALQKAETFVPDLMLLDVMMPGMDGFEVCRCLRANPRLAELPIVMVTALDDRESRLHGIEMGADDFMTKPFDRAELRARVRSITRLNRYRRLIETEEKLVYLANYDMLTGLPNRSLLVERLRQTLDRASRNQQGVAVLSLDLDSFQMINDSIGHEYGDKLLCEMAQRLTMSIAAGATVARLSSDEFAVMHESNNLVKDVSIMAQRLLNSVSKPVILNGHETVVTASIGVSVYPNDGDEPLQLLKNANTAMSRAKERGKNSYQFFTNEMNNFALKRLILENQLRKVLNQNELRVYYQPQIELKSGRIVGVEALLRWQHPELGLLSPGYFINAAEEMGLIIQIGEWVLRTACVQNQRWLAAGFPPLCMSVNVSSRQFQHPDLLRTVKQALIDSQLNPNLLELELTESVLMADNDSHKGAAMLTELQAMGVKIAIDDFGTGYSSLSYLKRFPVDTLKIDKAFVEDITMESEHESAIIIAIIAMAHSLKLSVVAEGVENTEQWSFLEKHQCKIAQGFLFCHPLSCEDMSDLLAQMVEGSYFKPLPEK